MEKSQETVLAIPARFDQQTKPKRLDRANAHVVKL
jgi:hypothetical protein